jgi:hypothetical protein
MGTGYLSRGLALTIHPHLAPRLKKEYNYNSTPLRAFMVWYKANFTFYLHLQTKKATFIKEITK